LVTSAAPFPPLLTLRLLLLLTVLSLLCATLLPLALVGMPLGSFFFFCMF
jgi:hypothetical protein